MSSPAAPDGPTSLRRTRRRTAAAALAAALLVPLTTSSPASAADPEPFTIVALPDTQNYVSTSANQAIMGVQTRWVVDHRDDLGVSLVAHLGDLVGDETVAVQWQRASTHMAVLDDAGVPSAVLPGNHDMDLTTGQAPLYQQHFPVSRYANASWNGPAASYGGYLGQGNHGPDAVDRQNMNSYTLLSAGGLDLLVLSLEFNPPDAAVDWARRVLAAHPDRRAILVTHSYTDLAGGLTRQVNRADGGSSGQDLWDELVSTSCSVFLVLSGHFSEGDAGEARRTDTNACGQPVHAVLSDYQDRARGGDGWLRYYTFDPAADEIRATTYSPTLDRYETDADSQFVLPYAMSGGPQTGPLAADAFGRTVSGGWGAADVGGTWAVGGGAARSSVAGGTGRQGLVPGGTVTATLGGLSAAATDVTTTLALERLAEGSVYATVSGRVVGTADYGGRVKVLPTGVVQVHTARSGTVLSGGTVPGLTLAPGERLRVRVQVEGTAPTTVRVRAWKDGTVEPATWWRTSTDATAALQAAGTVRLMAYAGSATTGGTLTVHWDDVVVTAPGGAPPPPPPPPANLPPVAAFEVTTDGLVAAVDAAGSSDPDGTVVARSWAFGDGATATGTTATHTYAAAGSYTVTLTVTDEDGATASTTRTVAVSAPPTGGQLAADTFARTLSGAWGSADVGGPWTLGGQAARFSVDGTAGVVEVPAGSTLTATLGAVDATATDTEVVLGVTAPPDGPLYATVTGRLVGSADYGARVKLLVGGGVQLHTERSGTVLAGGTLPGVTLGPGARLHVRVQVQGTTPTQVRTRAWVDGAPEPTTWFATSSDATAALQQPGDVRLMAYLSSSTTNGPAVVRWDDLVVAPPG